MRNDPAEALNPAARGPLVSVLLFWAGYVAITLAVGFATVSMIRAEVVQRTAWGFLSSGALLVLAAFLTRTDRSSRKSFELADLPSSLGRFCSGLLLGVAAFGAHIWVVTSIGGPIEFERVSGVGAVAACVYFVRFLATSCMEEIGFRGYPLQRLRESTGPWPAVSLTALAFGLSHIPYGYDLQSIALGVIPGGLVWGMSAVATRGLAVPIGLHAVWNFANWSAGGRAETGLFRMALEEDALQWTRTVGTASYLMISGALTVAFWLLYRRNVKRAALP